MFLYSCASPDPAPKHRGPKVSTCGLRAEATSVAVRSNPLAHGAPKWALYSLLGGSSDLVTRVISKVTIVVIA